MSSARPQRMLHLVKQARSNPQLAQSVAARLPEQLRLAFLDQLAQPTPAAPKVTAPKAARPGPRKCAPSAEQTGFSTQLNMFARSVSRVS